MSRQDAGRPGEMQSMGINGRNGPGRAARTARRPPVEPLLPTELPPLPPDAAGTPEPVAPPKEDGHDAAGTDAGGAAPAEAAEAAERRTGWRARLRLPRPPSRTDLSVLAVYVLGALYVLQRLVADPGGRVQDNVPDQTLFEWVLGFGSRVATDQLYPFVTDRLNTPVGINLLANTSVLGIGLPLTP